MSHSIAPQNFLTNELFSVVPTGAPFWRLHFGGSSLDAHICHVGRWGVAYRLYLNGRFTYSERFTTEEEARAAATFVRALRLDDGWLEQRSVLRRA